MKVRYHIFTLGCQMNVSDSQRITQKLEDLGYKYNSEKEADLIIINACSVRQHAVDRIWGKIKIWQNAHKKILITGCVLPIDKKKFFQKNIVFFDIKDLPNLDKILQEHFNILKNVEMLSADTKYTCLEYFEIKPKMSGRVAYVPIMTGCDNFCSYCAVPLTRGREISRPTEDITSDVQNAIKNGYKEILLLGQNVNSYGLKSSGHSETTAGDEESPANTGSRICERSFTNIQDDINENFIKLLKTIDDLPYDFQFNFISSNPHDMSNGLIKTLAKLRKWTRQLHLPLQSGDDEILKKMNRRYNSKQFLDLVYHLKLEIRDLKLSTDIIVGFPGETKKQFENTLNLCRKIGLNKAYIAQYSPRPGTAAAKLQDNVSKAEKKRRWKILDRLIN